MSDQDINELHWHLGLLQNLEVGLVVVDRDSLIYLWNGFMEHHSDIGADKATGQNLFKLFPELPQRWLIKQMEMVYTLNNPSYISWEQRPYLFPFKSQMPITGRAPHMFQNVTLIPLRSPTGRVDHVGIIIYDVTNTAVGQKRLTKANEKLKSLSRTDGLTGLYNRAYWQECLENEFNRFGRCKEISSLVMFDIDFFKKVNDTYGHQAGDMVIQSVANTLKQLARKTDVVGRYGGEEYAALLVGTNAENAMTFAERLRAAVEASLVQYEEHTIRFTISLGVAEVSFDQENALKWIHQADQALYQSKESGRNWVTMYNDPDK